MKKITDELLPKMRQGSVCQQWKRCGKPNCKCTRGKLHGPYFYRFAWHNGRQQKKYVPLSKVVEVQDACRVHRQQRETAKISQQHWRELIASLRTTEQQILSLIQG